MQNEPDQQKFIKACVLITIAIIIDNYYLDIL